MFSSRVGLALASALFASALVVACSSDDGSSSSARPSGASTGAGGGSAASCIQLSACCVTGKFPSSAASTSCLDAATKGDATTCAALLGLYTGNGTCAAPSGAGGGSFLGGGGAGTAGGTSFPAAGASATGGSTSVGGGTSLGGATSSGGSPGSTGGSAQAGHAGSTGTAGSTQQGCTQCPKGCFDLANDPANCGSCGYKCQPQSLGATATCSNGQCGETCTVAGQTPCNGQCVDTKSSNDNCGSCGYQCYAPSSCSNGQCACPGGGTYCGGSCIDTSSDMQNCGGCGKDCPYGATCTAGKCVCPGGQTACNGECVDVTSDASNCGGCGVSCADKAMAKGADASAATCEMGVCYVAGYAGVNCANQGACDGKSCDDLCKAQGLIACDPNKAPDNCSGPQVTQVGGCGFYSDMWMTTYCDVSYDCSQIVDGAATCGGSTYLGLGGINCQCKGQL